jgi:hypothetical protein
MRAGLIGIAIGRIRRVAEHDVAIAHSMELALLREALEAIADGCECPAEVARLALKLDCFASSLGQTAVYPAAQSGRAPQSV